MHETKTIAAVLPLVLTALAHQTPLQTSDCCKSLNSTGVKLILPSNTAAYEERIESYWSLTSQLHPQCFVQPANTEEVSEVVKTLVQDTKCEFAVRSGGHSSVAGWNNIADGVTIDLSRINQTDYNAETKIASLGPGARWLGVYRKMDSLNRGIQGGGIGSVGVGGLTLGGGFADYAYQRGLATDDVHNFEVVLGNGTVVQANEQNNKGFWRTLKGGGGGFGIVTRYDMYTFDHGPIWGSYREYAATPDLDEKHIQELKGWTDNTDAYESGSAYVWWTYRPADNKTILISQASDTAGQVNPDYARGLTDIPGYQTSTIGLTNISTSADATQAYGYRNIWWTLTMKNEEHVIRRAVQLHHSMVDEMNIDSSDGQFETQAYFQPLPTIIAKRGVEKGGNILGIDRIKENAVILLGSLAVHGKDQEALARQKMTAWLRAMEHHMKETDTWVDFRYMNYADGTQDVLSSYGEENVEFMRGVSKKYDPQGVFQRRTPGGYKLYW